MRNRTPHPTEGGSRAAGAHDSFNPDPSVPTSLAHFSAVDETGAAAAAVGHDAHEQAEGSLALDAKEA